MAARLALILAVLIVLGACRPATPPPSSADLTQSAPGPASGTSLAPSRSTAMPDELREILEGEYELGAMDPLQAVQLSDGSFEQGLPGSDDFISVRLTDFAAAGDLTADGIEEAAVLISENYGGSGVFVFLAVYARVDKEWRFQASTLVDDRPELRALSIERNEIFLDAVIHGAEDAMCCPTMRTTRHYRFVDNQLDMIDFTSFTPDGRPRTITIESPADGSDAFASIPIRGTVAVAPFENNLIYRIFDVSGIELSAGAITVSAPEAGAAGTFEAVIPLGNALSGSIVRLEVQDRSAADDALLAMDSVELVVK